jgi:FkbM family methyltransferase
MQITWSERISRRTSQWSQSLRAHRRGHIEVSFLDESVKFACGSSIPAGEFCLPRVSYRSRLVRDADFVQQRALAAYLESTPECRLFIDVGAFHGYYAVSVGKYLASRGGQVLAVEPDPANFEKLIQTVQLNGLEDTVRCVNVGCSDHCGQMHFNPSDSQGRLRQENDANTQPVEVKTLDSILDDEGIDIPIDCLMIDVEGAELPVLRGLSPERRAGSKMFVEMHPYAWADFDHSPEDFNMYLRSQGLVCIDMFHRIHDDFASDPWYPQYVGPTTLVDARALTGVTTSHEN